MSDGSNRLEDRVVAGVRLDKYAAVHAAVGDGFPRDLVLRHEGISPDAWDAIETAWAKAILDSAKGGGELVVAYDAQLLAAKDRMWRPMPPVDEDVSAWFDLLRHWAASEDKAALLAHVKIGLGDFTRLHRYWSQRLQGDDALRRQAFDALCKDPGPLPKVEPGPAVLPPPRESLIRAVPPPPVAPVIAAPAAETEAPSLPSLSVPLPPAPDDAPRSLKPPPRASVAPVRSITPAPRSYTFESEPPAPSAAAAKLTLATYASLCAELEVFPEAADRAYGKYGLHNLTARDAERASWEAHLARSPEARAEWQEHYAQFLNHWSTMKRSMQKR
jgi:hypothetical protein